jgi:hypothetical protein
MATSGKWQVVVVVGAAISHQPSANNKTQAKTEDSHQEPEPGAKCQVPAASSSSSSSSSRAAAATATGGSAAAVQAQLGRQAETHRFPGHVGVEAGHRLARAPPHNA